MDEKLPKLFRCRNWNYNYMCCDAQYNLNISPLYQNFKSNRKNFDVNCKGMSSPSLCVAFMSMYQYERKKTEEEKNKLEIFKRFEV